MGLTSTRYSVVFLFCLAYQLTAGQQLRNAVKVTGDVGVYGDFYHLHSDVPGAVKARRPSSLCRIIANTTVAVKDFSMPITMALPTGQYGEIMPYAAAISGLSLPNLKQMMRNPLNRVAIAPKYKWAQLTLGSQMPN